MSMRRFRIVPTFLLCAGLLSLIPRSAAAQSAQSIAEKMKAQYQDQLEQYQDQLENVDSYVVETSMSTLYHRKAMNDGAPALETEVKMTGDYGGSRE